MTRRTVVSPSLLPLLSTHTHVTRWEEAEVLKQPILSRRSAYAVVGCVKGMLLGEGGSGQLGEGANGVTSLWTTLHAPLLLETA